MLFTKQGSRVLRAVAFIQPADFVGAEDDHPFRPFKNKDHDAPSVQRPSSPKAGHAGKGCTEADARAQE